MTEDHLDRIDRAVRWRVEWLVHRARRRTFAALAWLLGPSARGRCELCGVPLTGSPIMGWHDEGAPMDSCWGCAPAVPATLQWPEAMVRQIIVEVEEVDGLALVLIPDRSGSSVLGEELARACIEKQLDPLPLIVVGELDTVAEEDLAAVGLRRVEGWATNVVLDALADRTETLDELARFEARPRRQCPTIGVHGPHTWRSGDEVVRCRGNVRRDGKVGD